MVNWDGDEEEELACAGCGSFKVLTPVTPSWAFNVCQRSINNSNQGPFLFLDILLLTQRSFITRYTSQIPKLLEAVFKSRLFKP